LIKTLSLLDEEIPEETSQSFSVELDRIETKEAPPEVQVQDRVSLQASTEASKSVGEDFSYEKIQNQVANRLKEMRSL